MRKVDEIKHEDGFHKCYLNIGIIGSFSKQLEDIAHAKKVFESEGFKVLAPKDTEISDERSTEGFLILQQDDNKRPRELEKDYLTALTNCHVIYVCNRDGYIGKSAMFEIGYLMYRRNCDVIFQEVPSEELIIDMLKDSAGNISNIMSPEEVCKSMKKSNYFSALDTKQFPIGDIPPRARYVEGAPIETTENDNTPIN